MFTKCPICKKCCKNLKLPFTFESLTRANNFHNLTEDEKEKRFT